jgi:hypothetical protein
MSAIKVLFGALAVCVLLLVGGVARSVRPLDAATKAKAADCDTPPALSTSTPAPSAATGAAPPSASASTPASGFLAFAACGDDKTSASQPSHDRRDR